MKVIFIHHSCFLVEVDEKVLIFDWFDGNRINGYQFRGQLPQYEADTPIYVFASHKHQDHFDLDVFHLAKTYQNIQFILSKDCKMSPRFMEKHGIDSRIREKITYVSPRARYEIEGGVNVETLRSTDAGVAFYVETNGACFFHAGDLNDWRFEGVEDFTSYKMKADFQREMHLLSPKKIHLAFVPVDPRLGSNQWNAMEYVLDKTDAEYVFPMHMWQNYTGITSFVKRQKNPLYAQRIVPITHENQEFDILEE